MKFFRSKRRRLAFVRTILHMYRRDGLTYFHVQYSTKQSMVYNEVGSYNVDGLGGTVSYPLWVSLATCSVKPANQHLEKVA